MVPDNAVELPKALHDPIARIAQVLAFQVVSHIQSCRSNRIATWSENCQSE